MSRKKLIFVSIFIVAALIFFWYLVEKDQQVLKRTLVNSETLPVAAGNSYYMKMQDNQVVIFNVDHSIFEYTDLEPEFLPDDIIEELVQGKYFQSQEELYEFLETYTS